ncbi:MAG: hypothetical protein DDT32_02277 [Syntrophomonadaceae bacterium]|nr:hypothetical protein [Bacillota bacterium]
MHITHSYIGSVKGPFKCLFFLLIEDYIEAQTQFVYDLNLELERFARKLADSGAVVKPFIGDIDTVRKQVLDKNWTENELREVQNTPGLLMINQDFNIFDPREHPWMIINFGRRKTDYVVALPFKGILDRLADAVLNPDEDFFVAANNLENEIRATELANVFEAKPGIFGFSVNLFYAGEILNKIFARMRSGKHAS